MRHPCESPGEKGPRPLGCRVGWGAEEVVVVNEMMPRRVGIQELEVTTT